MTDESKRLITELVRNEGFQKAMAEVVEAERVGLIEAIRTSIRSSHGEQAFKHEAQLSALEALPTILKKYSNK